MHLLFLQHLDHEILVGINASNRFLEILQELRGDETLDCDYVGDYVSLFHFNVDGHLRRRANDRQGDDLATGEIHRREHNVKALAYLAWTL